MVIATTFHSRSEPSLAEGSWEKAAEDCHPSRSLELHSRRSPSSPAMNRPLHLTLNLPRAMGAWESNMRQASESSVGPPFTAAFSPPRSVFYSSTWTTQTSSMLCVAFPSISIPFWASTLLAISSSSLCFFILVAKSFNDNFTFGGDGGCGSGSGGEVEKAFANGEGLVTVHVRVDASKAVESIKLSGSSAILPFSNDPGNTGETSDNLEKSTEGD
jgi:hypothetical protein